MNKIFNSNLYLCGKTIITEDEGSFLLCIDTNSNINKSLSSKKQVNAELMVSSQYGHYYPNLISNNNNLIYCIGGKEQRHCEVYDIEINKWSKFPDLPEGRYLSTLCFDCNQRYLYLFGGRRDKIFETDSILRIDTEKKLLVWERIIIKSKNEQKLLERISSGSFCFRGDKNIYIVGGEDSQGKLLDSIIKFNENKLEVKNTLQKLKFPTKFFNQETIQNYHNKYMCVLFDNYNYIHEIDKHDYLLYSEENYPPINI